MRAYGQGNGPTRAKTLHMNRRTAVAVSNVDERDMGIRAGVVRALGLDGEGEVIVDGLVVRPERVLRVLSHRWLTRVSA